MSTITLRLVFVAALASSSLACGSGASSGGDAGPPDPCEQPLELTCEDVDTCDEVYTSSSADQLRPLCDDGAEAISSFRCTLRQCCYHDDGLFGMPSLHCVSESIDPDYRTYCRSNGGTYCER